MTSRPEAIAAIDGWVQEFAEAALNPVQVDEFVRSVDEEIIAAIPEIAGDPALIEDLHASTRAHWRSFLVGLSDEFRLTLPPAAIALSLSIARRHLDINVLLKVYRVANKSVFRYLTERTRADGLPAGLPRDETLITLWLRAERWIDESIEQLIDHYTGERALLAEGAHARRAETIESLISGVDVTATAEQVLGHKLGLWQTAFVLSASPGNEADVAFFDIAVQLCQQLGLPRPLTHLTGSRELWGWAATPDEPTPELDEVADTVADLGLHLAVGRPCHGPAAFRTSHLQAVAAQRIGLRAAGPCHDYRHVELVSLLGDGELARDMVRRVLGPLLGRSKGEEALRATALAYLRSGQNVDATAEVLFVHPNTVRYRVGRIEDQLGGRIAHRAAVLEASLTWLDVYGPSGLA
ncbi:helix-turn-helix domain-containing protein [Nocardioides carbamazepini]|uniref:PucR family transcriptional regulator n=1 Tax=Nocardioides carbamazepini TaxID=2854259 RepID=UPI00214A2A20|nr:helix-turn-helix domain-containing protein [Nocardioides carbamazepini]MCR1785743.1 helix-turn-helix domain-containing protein [Nocardioides carbamazepini]